MQYSNFHSNFADAIKERDIKGAHNIIIREVGKHIVQNREDFCDVMRGGDIPVHTAMSDVELCNAYMQNCRNRKIMLGVAVLVNAHNKTTGFNGESEISDAGVKAAYKAIKDYWGDYATDDVYSNAGGMIGSIVQGGLDIGNKVADMQNKKKFGALDSLSAQQQAKSQLAQSVIAQRQAQLEAKTKENELKAKNKKIALIIGGSLLAVALGYYIYKHKKK